VSTHPLENRTLAALPAKEYRRLAPDLEPVELALSEILYEPDDSISHVYFVNSGMASLVSVTEEGKSIEVGIIGKEGVVGFQMVLEATTINDRVLIQTPGTAMRMKAKAFKDELDRMGLLQTILRRYTKAQMIQVRQSVVCNRFHVVEKRLARWLLISCDRTGLDVLPLTQEFLSLMLGASRPDVNVAAVALQRAGLISHTRGTVTILDREGLESASCECYRVIKKEFDWFLNI
jgi:CRP-like cAMP-binding protein